ncbi:HdeD family acid-resistance protein [Nostoc sp. UCD121]|uniref:HdeD family acid-resistance protein n=1 Tax=unclassified Nostoc TaxID=2593658 RepID=UPI0016294117|nr:MULTISPECIES: HdeD family acid-resistance protein [unclassified Nostoc]MBC1218649.1 HdeD family acid-resistance protein [Nostoc sp. UCD120]MBC1274883.1 HdeD family acid-resistance protein [Nostoc sp. UCD121]MBC1293593.1 HdeD family acid-resistance protein [Nostoc sp. UCD122]
MTADVSKDIKKDINGSLISGILLSILGVIAIAAPSLSTLFAETWIAVILIFAGFTKLVYATQTRHEGGFIWKLLLSGLYIATGIMLFVYPYTGILTLTLLLGSFLLAEGTFELILAFKLRPQGNWTWILGDGIITLVLGAMIWFQWPFNSPWLLGTLVGVSVIFTGISRVMLSLNGRSISSSTNEAANPT